METPKKIYSCQTMEGRTLIIERTRNSRDEIFYIFTVKDPHDEEKFLLHNSSVAAVLSALEDDRF
jgi:hypothetical protein